MKKRRPTFSSQANTKVLKGFDDYQLRLGDIMRGERATLGKSLLDVQRDLRIKASYISAIENCDQDAFDTPGFVVGYVKSYAKYLGMSPDDVFQQFCSESGFATSTALTAKQRSKKTYPLSTHKASSELSSLAPASAQFITPSKSTLEHFDARAIGSTMIMMALIGSIGFGAWSVIEEVQRVQVSPAENTPIVLSDLDPIGLGVDPAENQENPLFSENQALENLDRLYRPQALEVPILVARDAPISSLDPSQIGNFKPKPASIDVSEDSNISLGLAEILTNPVLNSVPKVVEDAPPRLALFAVRPAWVQVKASDGTTIYERIMDPGEEFILPQTEVAPKLRAGMSGSLYFAVNGYLYGPAGDGAQVVKQIPLSVDSLTQSYQLADVEIDPQLQKVVAEADVSSFTIPRELMQKSE